MTPSDRNLVEGHVALIGDSVFDNAAYTGGRPDVVSHLRAMLPVGARATLLASDGNAITDVAQNQVPRLPRDVTHAAVSMGGNDAILQADALDLPVVSTRDALLIFGDRAAAFEAGYRHALDSVLDHVPNVVVCTIYNPNFAADAAALARVGLMMFNDVILRVAFERSLPVVDLRLVIVDAADYANELEPSSRGGEKIARSLSQAFGLTTPTPPVSQIFGAVSRLRRVSLLV